MAYWYRKAGVVLSELWPAGTGQGALFTEAGDVREADPEWPERQAALMAAVDRLNGRSRLGRWGRRRRSRGLGTGPMAPRGGSG